MYHQVIDKNPEEFKIRCLMDIRRCFEGRNILAEQPLAERKNPFFAGYGNRPNVRIASVGLLCYCSKCCYCRTRWLTVLLGSQCRESSPSTLQGSSNKSLLPTFKLRKYFNLTLENMSMGFQGMWCSQILAPSKRVPDCNVLYHNGHYSLHFP